MNIMKWLETLAAKYSRSLYYLGLLLLALAAAAVAGDYLFQLSAALSPRSLRRIGKGMGEVAANLAIVALGYYILREAFVRLLPKGQTLPFSLALPYLKAGVTILRLLHPALGLAAIALAATHGYLMWLSTGGLKGGLAVASGLAVAGGGAVLAVFGGLIILVRPGLTARRGHRLAAFAVVLLYAFHMLFAD